jgi:predicted ester cyclase
MSVERNKERYRRFVAEVLNAGNAEAAGEFLLTEFVDNTPKPESLQDFKAWLAAFRRAFPDAHWEIDLLIGEGDFVVNRKTVRGTHQGEFLGLAPTGRRVEVSETVIVRFADGKMVEFWGDYEDRDVLAQLEGNSL